MDKGVYIVGKKKPDAKENVMSQERLDQIKEDTKKYISTDSTIQLILDHMLYTENTLINKINQLGDYQGESELGMIQHLAQVNILKDLLNQVYEEEIYYRKEI